MIQLSKPRGEVLRTPGIVPRDPRVSEYLTPGLECNLRPAMKKLLLVFSLTLAGADTVAGQVIVQPGNIFQSPLALIENRDAQKDVKFTDEQARKLVELSRAYAEGMRGIGFTPADQEKRKKA